MSDELNVMNPGVELVIKGETIIVMPFLFGSYAKVAKIMKEIGPAVRVNITANNVDYLGLIADAGESIFDLCALAIKKPRAYFESIDGADGLSIIAAVVEQNKEEFSKKIAPAFEKLVKAAGLSVELPATVTEATPGDQSTPS